MKKLFFLSITFLILNFVSTRPSFGLFPVPKIDFHLSPGIFGPTSTPTPVPPTATPVPPTEAPTSIPPSPTVAIEGGEPTVTIFLPQTTLSPTQGISPTALPTPTPISKTNYWQLSTLVLISALIGAGLFSLLSKKKSKEEKPKN